MKTIKSNYYPILIFVITLIVCLLCIKEGHQWGDDFSQYFAQARAICQGTTEQFVEDNTFNVLNSSVDMATPVYPWGFPLLLSFFYPFFKENIVLYKLINCVLIALVSALLYVFLNKYLKDKKLSFVLSLGFGLNYSVLKYVNNVVSDFIFLILCLYSYIVMSDYFNEEPEPVKLVILGLAMGYSYMCRSQGIALILSYIICEVVLLIKTKKINYKRLIPVIGAALVILLDKILLPHGSRSSLYFLDSLNLNIFLSNIAYYFLILKEMMPVPAELQEFFYVIGLIIVFIGTVVIIRKKESIYKFIFIVFSFLFFTGINLLFPFHQGSRYMLPCFPLFMVLLGYGIEYIFSLIRNKKITISLQIILLVFLSIYGVYSYAYLNILNNRQYDKGAYTDEAKELYEYIDKNTDSTDVFCFFKPRGLYMLTGRLSYKPAPLNKDTLQKADYLIECDEDDYVRTSNLSDMSFEKVFENTKYTVYKINH